MASFRCSSKNNVNFLVYKDIFERKRLKNPFRCHSVPRQGVIGGGILCHAGLNCLESSEETLMGFFRTIDSCVNEYFCRKIPEKLQRLLDNVWAITSARECRVLAIEFHRE